MTKNEINKIKKMQSRQKMNRRRTDSTNKVSEMCYIIRVKVKSNTQKHKEDVCKCVGVCACVRFHTEKSDDKLNL